MKEISETKKDVTALVKEGAIIKALDCAVAGELPFAWINRLTEIIIEKASGDHSLVGMAMTVMIGKVPDEWMASLTEASLPTLVPFIGGGEDDPQVQRIAIQKELNERRNRKGRDIKALKAKLKRMLAGKRWAKAREFMSAHDLPLPAVYSDPLNGYQMYLKRRAIDERREKRNAQK